MFMSDLARAIDLPVEFDFMAVSSYGSATRTSGVVRIIKDLDLDLTDRHVLIVEDIVDSGLTLAYLRKNLAARGPASLEVCALLVKEGLQKARPRPEVRRLRDPARRSSSGTGSTSASATATCPRSTSTRARSRADRLERRGSLNGSAVRESREQGSPQHPRVRGDPRRGRDPGVAAPRPRLRADRARPRLVPAPARLRAGRHGHAARQGPRAPGHAHRRDRVLRQLPRRLHGRSSPTTSSPPRWSSTSTASRRASGSASSSASCRSCSSSVRAAVRVESRAGRRAR